MLHQLPRSHREHGLHERSVASGASLPCPISWIEIPLKESVDDRSDQVVQWPILMPKDFASRLKPFTQVKFDFLK